MFQDMQIPVLPIGGGETQKLIAHVQDTTTADINYVQGQQFIMGGVLFKVKKSSISAGSTINMDTDVEVADTVTNQIGYLEAYTVKPTYFTNNFAFRKIGKLVVFVYASDVWTGTNIPAGDLGYIVAAGTIPEKFRPTYNVAIYTVSPPNGVGIIITTTGGITAYNASGGVITKQTSNRFPHTPYWVA